MIAHVHPSLRLPPPVPLGTTPCRGGCRGGEDSPPKHKRRHRPQRCCLPPQLSLQRCQGHIGPEPSPWNSPCPQTCTHRPPANPPASSLPAIQHGNQKATTPHQTLTRKARAQLTLDNSASKGMASLAQSPSTYLRKAFA